MRSRSKQTQELAHIFSSNILSQTLAYRTIHTMTSSHTNMTESEQIPSLPLAWKDPLPSYHTMYPCLRLPIEEASMVVIATDLLQRELAICMSLIDDYLDHLCDPKNNPVPPTYAAYSSEFKPSIPDTKALPFPSQVTYYDYDPASALPVPTHILPHFTPAGATPSFSPQRALSHNPYTNTLAAPRPSLRALAVSTFLSAPILSLAALGLTPLGLLHAAGYSHDHVPREYRQLGPLMGNMYLDSASVHDMDKVRVQFTQQAAAGPSGATAGQSTQNTVTNMLRALEMTEEQARALNAEMTRLATDYKAAREFKRQNAAKLLQRVLCERLRAAGVKLCVFVGEGDAREEAMWREGVAAEQAVEEALRRCLAARGEGKADAETESVENGVVPGLRGLSNVAKVEIFAGLWASPQLRAELDAELREMHGAEASSGNGKNNGDASWGISPENVSFLRRVIGGVEAGWIDNELIASVISGSREGGIYACELVDTRRGDGTMKGKRELKALRRQMGKSEQLARDEEESESESDVGDVEDGMVVVHRRDDAGEGNNGASSMYGEGVTQDPNFASLEGEDGSDDESFLFRRSNGDNNAGTNDPELQSLLLPMPAPTPAQKLAFSSLYTDFGPLVEVDFVQGLGRQKRLLGNFNPKSPLVQSVLGSRNAKAAKPSLPTSNTTADKSGKDAGKKIPEVSLSFWDRLNLEDAKKNEKLTRNKNKALVTEIVPERVALQRAEEAREKRLQKAKKHEEEQREQRERRQMKLREKMESMTVTAQREGLLHEEAVIVEEEGKAEVEKSDDVAGKGKKGQKDGKESESVATEEGKLIVDPETGNIKRVYRILDVTGGFGTDSFVVASSVRQNSDVDVELTLVERNPVMFLLLSDGVRRAQQTGEVYHPMQVDEEEAGENVAVDDKGRRLRVADDGEYVEVAADADADNDTDAAAALKLAKEEEENLRSVLGDVPVDAQSGIPRFFRSDNTVAEEKQEEDIGSRASRVSEVEELAAGTDVITDMLTTRVPIPSFRAAVTANRHTEDSERIAALAEETLFNYIRSGMGEEPAAAAKSPENDNSQTKLRTGTSKARFAHFARASDLHQADVAIIARRMRVLHGDSVEYLARYATKIGDGEVSRKLLLQPHNELLKPFREYVDARNKEMRADKTSRTSSVTALPPSPTAVLSKFSRSLLAANSAHSPFAQTSVLAELHAAGAIAPLSPNHRQYDVVYMDPFYPSKQAGKHAKNKKRLRNTKLMGFAKLLRDIDEKQAFLKKGVVLDHRYGHKSDGTYTLIDGNTSKPTLTSSPSEPTTTTSAASAVATTASKSSAVATALSPPLLDSAEAAWALRVCLDVMAQRHNEALTPTKRTREAENQQLRQTLLSALPALTHAIPFPYAPSSDAATADASETKSERTSRLRVLPLAPMPPTYRTEPYNTELMCVLARLAALLRVVVKRPKHAPVMFKEEAMSFKDRKTRFDVVPPVGGKREAKRMLAQTIDRMLQED